LNAVLDPLLIFTCSLGVAGAALATVIAGPRQEGGWGRRRRRRGKEELGEGG